MRRHVNAKTVAAAVALAAFLALFRVGWTLRAEADARNTGGDTIQSVAIVPWLAAKEKGGLFPPLDAASGRLTWRSEDVRPAYVMGDKLAGPPEDPALAIIYGNLDGYKAYTLRPLVDPRRYFYLGYAVTSEAEGLALLEALRRQRESGTVTTEDMAAPAGAGSFGSDRFYRLRENFGAAAPEGIGARVPLVIERPGNYGRPGAWVVFLDRHSEFIPYPGPFPMTEAFVKALEDAVR